MTPAELQAIRERAKGQPPFGWAELIAVVRDREALLAEVDRLRAWVEGHRPAHNPDYNCDGEPDCCCGADAMNAEIDALLGLTPELLVTANACLHCGHKLIHPELVDGCVFCELKHEGSK